MAASRALGPLLEQPRRRTILIALSALLVAGVVAGAALFVQPPPKRVPGHAYSIPSPAQRITVEVLNGTRRTGAARSATRLLRRRGLDVVFFGNAERASDSTRVILRRGDPARAREVREALGVGRIVVEPDTFRRVDVSVVLGQDFTVPADLPP